MGTILRRNKTTGEQMIDKIHAYISKEGFTFDKEFVANFYLSLKTKPFVILTGISGTGKTKLAQLFAEAVYESDVENFFKLVPVQPDWTSPRFLLGFFNPLTGKYDMKPFLEILMKAVKDPEYAFFVCLDEMNLAKVEYYFSTFLSAIESDEQIDLHSDNEYKQVPRIIPVPRNLFFIGTVNIDETTHQFSPKVLDRANTIEFNDVDLLDLFKPTEETTTGIINAVDYDEFNKEFLKKIEDDEILPDWLDWLKESGKIYVENYIQPVHAILEKSNLHFGYRVRDEILEYMFWARNMGREYKDFMDLQIMQKILPKIKGGPSIDKDRNGTLANLEKFLKEKGLKKSEARVEQMREQLKEEGYTSFWR
jgi:5-methylcytosine-specific restriction enzyme B